MLIVKEYSFTIRLFSEQILLRNAKTRLNVNASNVSNISRVCWTTQCIVNKSRRSYFSDDIGWEKDGSFNANSLNKSERKKCRISIRHRLLLSFIHLTST